LERRRLEASAGVFAVSSAAAGEGKTTTAINLAGALAQGHETRVLLIDADLRLPSVAAQLGLPADLPGLVDLVADAGAELRDVVRLLPRHNLAVLPAGRTTRTPYEILRSLRLAEAVGEARGLYDYILIDSPPLVPLPDGRLLARSVDGFLLVVAAHHTQRSLVAEALDLLEPQQIIGIVFNGYDRPLSSYYGYYGAYLKALHGDGRDRSGRPTRTMRRA
jgi:capsular exopolysaccharide synthesis family protein